MQLLSERRRDECEAGDEWAGGVKRQASPRWVMVDKQVWIAPFKDMSECFQMPTNPCARAYRYARIRRLVRLGVGR